MEDLDHSIHIAEIDWSSFYDESEECDLLQPSLAYPDDSGLSDSEDSENSGLVFRTGQQEPQWSTDANSGGAETKCVDESCTSCTESPEQPNQKGERRSEGDAATTVKPVERCTSCALRNTITTELVHRESAQEITEETTDRGIKTLQTVNYHSSEETRGQTNDGAVQTVGDLKSSEEADLLSHNRAELSVNQQDATERAASDASAEKERWFVTVNDNLARRRAHSTSAKKKRRQKKACEGGGHAGIILNGRKRKSSVEKAAKMNVTKQKSTKSPSDEVQADLCFMSGDLSEILLEQEQSYKLEDCVDFFPLRSFDSESCLSAAESVEQTQHPLQETGQLLCSLSLTRDSLTESTEVDRVEDEQMSPQFVAAANCECYESPTSDPSVTFPSCRRPAEIPDDNSTSEIDSRSETSGPQMEDYLSRLHSPDSPLTTCSATDSPETYARAAGHSKPVYAISHFWDEMEKLTINDILQVRESRFSPPEPIQETVTPNPTNHSLQVEAVESSRSDSGLMDTSDTADSDYFTQPDESKPDGCSCEFLTSDFEDEYWNPSPGFNCRNQPDATSFCEDSSTNSEGRETPVPVEDFLGHCSDNQTIESSLSLSRRRHLGEKTDLNPNSSLETFLAACFHTGLQDARHQISFPETTECFFTESEADTESQSLIVYDPEEIFVAPDFDSTLCALGQAASSSSLRTSVDKPIPIFCSHRPVRELPFPKQRFVFLRESCEKEDEISPIRVVSQSFIQASSAATAAAHCWKNLLSVRRICFPCKGSICHRSSGAWMFPSETEDIQIRKENPALSTNSMGKVSPDSSKMFTEPEEPQYGLETIRTTKRDGIFSAVKQSDMCLVCVAFASWVLRSSDPEAADAWKAALLANVSALSAIQYLRQYMKKNLPQEEL